MNALLRSMDLSLEHAEKKEGKLLPSLLIVMCRCLYVCLFVCNNNTRVNNNNGRRMEEGFPDMEASCKRIEYAVADSRQYVVLHLGGW